MIVILDAKNIMYAEPEDINTIWLSRNVKCIAFNLEKRNECKLEVFVYSKQLVSFFLVLSSVIVVDIVVIIISIFFDLFKTVANLKLSAV